VYAAGAHRFRPGADDAHVVDAAGRAWLVHEDRLQAAADPRLSLPRVPAHRAFWFGWFAQHPDTVLIK
jgi:hypothetical protein